MTEFKYKFFIEGTKKPRSNKKIIQIESSSSINNRNLSIGYNKDILEKIYNKNRIDPIIEDLLNISLATFYADLSSEREVLSKKKKIFKNKINFFSRNIELDIPVNNLELWNKNKYLLEKIISFITYDNIKFIFREIGPKDETKLVTKTTNYINSGEFDCISLFSGGLDSFAGSFYLEKNEYKPFYLCVSHHNIGKIVQELFEDLQIKEKSEIIRVCSNTNISEFTQFSRSFLYINFAFAFAYGFGLDKIFIPENGIISFQLFKKGRCPTRTVHPILLEYLNNFMPKLFDSSLKIKIINPFEFYTKGEVIKEISDSKKYLIPKTISCSHYSKYNDTKQCGMCLPCIIRRIALTSNKFVPDDDRKISKYGIEAFDINLINPKMEDYVDIEEIIKKNMPTKKYFRDAISMLFDIFELTHDIKNLPKVDLLREYPVLDNEKLLKMYQNFADEVIETIKFFKTNNNSLKNIYFQLSPKKP